MLEITGIKCDSCDYNEPTVEFSEYEYYIDKPCPKCGVSLLTIQDYKRCVSIIKWHNRISKLLNIASYLNPLRYIIKPNSEYFMVSIKYPKRKLK